VTRQLETEEDDAIVANRQSLFPQSAFLWDKMNWMATNFYRQLWYLESYVLEQTIANHLL
jgi:hypothetical protein